MSTVHRAVELQVVSAGIARMRPGDLEYDTADPLALTLTIPQPAPVGPAVWHVARDLLSDGLHCGFGERAGLGDVVTWSSGDQLQLLLRGPNGWALVGIGRADLHAVLQRSYRLVPRGSEDAAYGLSAQFQHMLADGDSEGR